MPTAPAVGVDVVAMNRRSRDLNATITANNALAYLNEIANLQDIILHVLQTILLYQSFTATGTKRHI